MTELVIGTANTMISRRLVIAGLTCAAFAPAEGALADNENTAASASKSKISYIVFRQEINDKSFVALGSLITSIMASGINNITLVMSSDGGFVEISIEMYNFLVSLPINLTTYNLNVVKSAATIVFLAGSQRFSAPGSIFLFHEQKLTFNGTQETKDWLESVHESETLTNRFSEIYKSRTSLDEPTLEAIKQGPIALDARQAQKFGIVQDVKPLTMDSGTVSFVRV